ncbi:MAG: DUF3788 family protein [Acidobacteria bacterium]|nr:DUF3788 family protein [Acidobacteriota bacterium]MBI3489862.1 DUF3788 family protein [Acidobacteriota bacterium]
MPVTIKAPNPSELKDHLGAALSIWNQIVKMVEATHGPLVETWKPSKTEFGRMCLLQHKKKTLVYLTPGRGQVWVAIILGERAFQLAMASSSLRDEIKIRLREAKPYAEGRGIRFSVERQDDLASIAELLEVKTART